MILTTNSMGEFILVPEAANLYEEFAAADAYATLDDQNPNETGSGTFDLYKYYYYYDEENPPETAERRVVVRCSRVYGRYRRFSDLKFDLPWPSPPRLSVTCGPDPTPVEAWLDIRAVTSSFEPETITWNWAYVTGGGNLSLDDAVCSTRLLGTNEEVNEFDLDLSWGAFPHRAELPSAWQNLEAIYGFEFRLRVEALYADRYEIRWHPSISDTHARAYVILV